MKLCFCNNCMTVLEDTNPQIGAKEYEDHLYSNVLSLTTQEDEDGFYQGCPNCNSDGYLSDDVPDEFFNTSVMNKITYIRKKRRYLLSPRAVL